MSKQVAKVLCHEPPGRVDLRDCPLEPLRDGQVLVQTEFSAISPGTELRCLRGEQPGGAKGAFVPGYQSVGRIIEVGPNCRRRVGELVFSAAVGGYGNRLAAMWGAHSSHVVASERNLVDLPNGICHAEAAMAKLVAIALHGLNMANVASGDRIAVIGLGALGQLSARLAKARGAEVIAFDRMEQRAAIARKFGIDAVTVTGNILEAAARMSWPEKEFDVIVDVTGVPSLIDEFVQLARKLEPWDAPERPGTRYVIQGSYPGDVSFNYQASFLKEISFLIPRDQNRTDLETALQIIASGALHMESLSGETVSPTAARNVYSELASNTCNRLTAVFDWSQFA